MQVLSPDQATAGASGALAPGIGSEEPFRGAASVIHVATTGSDATGDGTAAKPFASLGKAQTASRAAAKPAAVSVAAGKYFLNATLTLGSADSGVSYAAAPGAAVTLSGGVSLKPTWKPSVRFYSIPPPFLLHFTLFYSISSPFYSVFTPFPLNFTPLYSILL